MKIPTKAIITDAGLASRYLPITKTIPKGMLPLGNKPIMHLVVEECVSAGIKEIIIVSSKEGKPIYEDYFYNNVSHIHKQLKSQGKEERYDVVRDVLDLPKIIVIEQDPSLPYGNGSPIVSARDYISNNEAFLVLYSDDVVFGESDALQLLEAYKKYPDALGIVAAQEINKSETKKYGIFNLKEYNKLDYIIEKPSSNKAPSSLASYGRYLVTPKIFDFLIAKNTGLDNELWTVDAITKMAEIGDVYVVPTKGKWMTTGDPKNYFLAHLNYVLENEKYSQEVKDLISNLK